MTVTREWIHNALFRKVSIAPLVTFRILFGLVMLAGIVRFWLNGWVEMQFIQPDFHFKYFGFHWVPEPGPEGYYALFLALALAALGIALGMYYRLSALLFFLAFSHIELVDASYYLNHYYFISIVALILVFLPAHRAFSLDVKLGRVAPLASVPAGNINILKFQLALVYLFAGVAKLNADWLFHAMPLKIWLPAQDGMPLIGGLFAYKWTAYAFSWAGALYDLTVVFFLLWAPARWLAYGCVIVFHLLTWLLFQIGMFPFIMIGATLIFFSAGFHKRLLGTVGYRPGREPPSANSERTGPRFDQIGFGYSFAGSRGNGLARLSLMVLAGAFIMFQLVFPLRYLAYPGNPFWHEQGYRFGWRVMLMEKAGYARFRLVDEQGRSMEVDNSRFLTPVQEKMMSTQPDFMIQYAKFLQNHYAAQGLGNLRVHADVFVTLNGRASRRYIDPGVDLASLEDSWEHKDWILPMEGGRG